MSCHVLCTAVTLHLLWIRKTPGAPTDPVRTVAVLRFLSMHGLNKTPTESIHAFVWVMVRMFSGCMSEAKIGSDVLIEHASVDTVRRFCGNPRHVFFNASTLCNQIHGRMF